MIEIKTFVISYPGDESVGIPPIYFELTGPFQFEDEVAIKEFKGKLSEAFEYLEDGKPGDIVTNKEYEAWVAGEVRFDKEMEELEEEFMEMKDDELYFL